MSTSLFRSLVNGFFATILISLLAWPTYAFQHGPIAQAIAAQERHTERLLGLADVVGTAAGVSAQGEPVIKVYTRVSGVRGIPASLDGVPVEVEVTGEFLALHHRPGHSGGPGGGEGGTGLSTTDRWPRPVPIGISSGNEGECSAGTIAARLASASGFYALSNNHVYALENNAPLGSHVLQPGRFDSGCTTELNDSIGTLADFEPINFNCVVVFFIAVCDPAGDNRIDAAIALSSTADLGNATPSDGYGMPKSATVPASLDMNVQKYGRTTQLTKGQVSGINATVLVGYSSGYARFVDQIIVSSRKPFIKAGDSGSLLVTDPDRNPTGLLFAGSSDGKTAIANPIGDVLGRFSVTVDGE